jgi:2,3-bisphosphoglycerate-independent phosphoglycerate mutase
MVKASVAAAPGAVRRRRCIFIIVDGLGDLPVPALGNLTPLEAARTPTLDRLASAGVYGQVDPVGEGITPSTDSGTGMLLGMLPGDADRLKRGPVEAAGARLPLGAGDVALRANFASILATAGGYLVTDRRAGRIRRRAAELGALIQRLDLGDGVVATFQPTEQHRGVLILSGAGLDPAISGTDPGEVALPAVLPTCHALMPAAQKTAAKINRFTLLAHELLATHPVNVARAAAGKPVANGVITRGAGSPVALENVITRKGIRAAVVTGCTTVQGLARLFDFDVITDSRFTADVDTDLDGKIQAALESLDRHDLCFVHIKAPDICAHDRQPEAKRRFIEGLDAAMAPLLKHDIVTALAADHSTDSNTGMHTADPVPALVYVPGARPVPGANEQGAIKFGERACRRGTLPRQTSAAFLQGVLANLAEPV